MRGRTVYAPLALMLASACGESGKGPGTPRDAGAPDVRETVMDAAVDARSDSPPLSATGLDERPRNVTCRAPAKPTRAALDPFPRTLKATGCFDPVDPRKPGPALIPYAVNAPLWSDTAEKERYLALPDGAKIHVNADDDWDLPRGTVLVKTFHFGPQRIETRLFVRHADGEWAGYTYEWNSAQTDATLVDPGGKAILIGDVDWSYPSRTDCMKCHTAEAGHSLGLETAQLNGSYRYPDGRMANQLATFVHLGLFDAPLRAPPAALPALAPPFVAGRSVEERARAYLHGNCAGCHRPGVVKNQALDLRYGLTIADTMSCDHRPQASDLGYGPDSRILKPGDPDSSLLTIRMQALNSNRMPPLASGIVDAPGLNLIQDWIRSLKSCP